MGFGRKVWWLLLAGVLLAVAATTVAGGSVEEDGATAGVDGYGGNDMCDSKCAHWRHDENRRQMCVNECKSREWHHMSRQMCEIKCQHHQDPVAKQRCVNYCTRYQLTVGGLEEEDVAAAAAEAIRQVV